MKKRIIYTDAPEDIAESIREGEEIENFFPPNTKFIKKQSMVNIPINSQIVHHFKKYAQEHNTQYQTAINDVLMSHIRQQ